MLKLSNRRFGYRVSQAMWFVCMVSWTIVFLAGCNSDNESLGMVFENELQEVITLPITDINDSSAIGGVSIKFKGESTKFTGGICWSTSPDPTIEDFQLVNNMDAGRFVTSMLNLDPRTTYYVRAFAFKSDDGITEIIYGDQLDFTTPDRVFNNSIVFSTQEEVDEFGKSGYTAIAGRVDIGVRYLSPTNITNLNGLSEIKWMGYLTISNNDFLVNLDGLENLTSVKTVLYVTQNQNLENIEGLRNLTHVESLRIWNNPSLLSLDGLHNTPSIMEDVSIFDCDKLTSLKGLEHLVSLNYFSIGDNENILNLDDLSNISSVENKISIIRNKSLVHIDALNQITSLDYELIVWSNISLENLDGLQNITSGTIEKLSIWGNDMLTNIDGVSGIISVTRELDIIDNVSLKNLDGLTNIVSAGTMQVISNDNLNDLCGLKTLIENDGITGTVSIGWNAYNPTTTDIVNDNCRN